MDEHDLVFRAVFHLEEFCEAYYRIQWRTYLETHVVEESILDYLYLLGT